MALPFTVLVLDDDENALSGMVELLRDAGHQATGAATFDAAKRLLGVEQYDLLVTDVRVRSFNGLRLIQEERTHHPQMAILIVTGYPEPLLELEAGRYGAAYMVKPIKPREFLETAQRLLANVRRERRWPRKRVAIGVGARVGGQHATVVDVCYGGLRVEVTEPSPSPLPTEFLVDLPAFRLSLPASQVWAGRDEGSGAMCCGLEVPWDDSPTGRAWRNIVDVLP
jgi:DNA-binding response OmpR family regulator